MKILIYVHSPTWFTEVSLLGKFLDRAGHDVVFHIVDFGHWSTHDFARRLAEDGIPYILESEHPPPRTTWVDDFGMPVSKYAGRADRRLIRGIRNWLEKIETNALLEFRDSLESLENTIADARALIRLKQPDLVVVGGDNPGYSTPAVIEGAHNEGIPVVIVPSTMSNGLEEAEVFAGDPRYHVDRSSARLVSELFPHWVLMHKESKLLRCPPGRALALEALGIAPPEPWIFNSGFADAITAESPAMVDYAAIAGLPRHRMSVTGTPSDDLMYTILKDAAEGKRKLYQELSLPADRSMLLTALPPDFLYLAGGRPQCDFRDYDTLVKEWIDALADQNSFNVVVALHPSVEIETMLHIERANVRIAARRTSELVPLCDLYVASVSSTIRWAIACGKPVINYDVYRYRYTDFLNIDGVLIMEELEEYRAAIHRLARQPSELERLRQSQTRAAAHWGFLDGQCSERILKVFTEVRQRGTLNSPAAQA